jgi:hypothetical protein
MFTTSATRRGASAAAVFETVEAVAAARDQRHCGSRAGQGKAGGLPDAAARAGDHRHGADETLVHDQHHPSGCHGV